MAIERNPQNDADVQILLRLFPDVLPDGRTITHEQIETALRLSRVSSRYKTVTGKWRRVLMDEKCVFLDGLSGEGRGFVALTPDEMVRYANRSVRTAGRRLRKALVVASMPDDAALSEDVRLYRARLTVAVEQIARQHRAALRDVSRSLLPMQQLPKASGQD